MMLETDAESENYVMTTSRCENRGKLSWDNINKKVLCIF